MASAEWKRANQDKVREYRRNWYAKHQKDAKDAVRRRKREIRKWFDSYKSQLRCARCFETHPACLEFHHRDPQKKEIVVSKALVWGWSIERILKEIAKCEVLCANCHRKQHWSGASL
jgi:hypothetical protein